MHSQPGSPKKPCWATMSGTHQWYIRNRKILCWICGARRMASGNYGES